MGWRVEFSDFVLDQADAIGAEYGRSGDDVLADLFAFATFKTENPAAPYPKASADKPSGVSRTGKVFAPYTANNIHHCHLDYHREDPMIVYRLIPAQKVVRNICIATHEQMFINKDEFVRAQAGELPKGKKR